MGTTEWGTVAGDSRASRTPHILASLIGQEKDGHDDGMRAGGPRSVSEQPDRHHRDDGITVDSHGSATTHATPNSTPTTFLKAHRSPAESDVFLALPAHAVHSPTRPGLPRDSGNDAHVPRSGRPDPTHQRSMRSRCRSAACWRSSR